MPTGYTAGLTEKETSFEEFALRCARAFGACATLREEPFDNPIPDKFEVYDYHLKKIAEAKQAIEDFESKTPLELQTIINQRNEEIRERRQNRREKSEKIYAAYSKMLTQAKNWQPPTPDHQGLQKFMVEQLETSMSDALTEEQIIQYNPFVEGEGFRERELKSLFKNLQYHEQEHQKEIDRTNMRNQWVSALRKSLKEVHKRAI